MNEYAFALGALAHSASDTMGHPAVNRAVAMEFPKLHEKFGDQEVKARSRSAKFDRQFPRLTFWFSNY